MTTKPSDCQEIRVTAATFKGPFKVDTGAGNGRAVHFPTLAAARSFVDGFAVDRLTVQIGRRLPELDAFMR